jgi:hypothetical protein
LQEDVGNRILDDDLAGGFRFLLGLSAVAAPSLSLMASY